MKIELDIDEAWNLMSYVVGRAAEESSLPDADRAKIRFIHLNHTNPALRPDSAARQQIERAGFHVAEIGERVGL